MTKASTAPLQREGERERDAPALTLDVVLHVLGRTLFSPFFCVWVAPTIAGRLKTWHHPAVFWSAGWAGVLLLFAALRYIDRVYTARHSYFFLPPKLDWEDQIVLITGGIGALLAETLALRNVTVVVLTKHAPASPIENDNVHTYLCDVSDCHQVQEVAQRVQKEVGDPTIIVNNAGVVKGKLLLDLTEDDVRDTFGANTLGQFWVLKAFLPALVRAGRGHIVTASSVMGLVGAAQNTDYCASKAALISLHHTLTHELRTRYASPRIRTTLLLPSFIRTPLFSSVHLPSDTVSCASPSSSSTVPASASIASRLAALPPRLYSSLFTRLAPPLDPHDVVKALIAALDTDQSTTIRLPAYTHIARVWGPGAGFVPRWMGDAVQWLTGADWAMRAYGPKPDAGERLVAEREGERERDAPGAGAGARATGSNTGVEKLAI